MVYGILFTLIFSAHLSAETSSEELSTQSKENLCAIISFAQKNKSEINKNDLFHCHIITAQNGPNLTNNLSLITEQYSAMLCHAHEYDSKRQFAQSEDNVNIFIRKDSVEPYYLGVMKTAVAIDIKNKVPDLVSGFPKLVNQLNFYKLQDKQCGGFKKFRILHCLEQNYCVGSAEDHEMVLDSNNSTVPSSNMKSSPVVQ